MSSPGEHRALGGRWGEKLRGVALTQRAHLQRPPEFCLPPGQAGARALPLSGPPKCQLPAPRARLPPFLPRRGPAPALTWVQLDYLDRGQFGRDGVAGLKAPSGSSGMRRGRGRGPHPAQGAQRATSPPAQPPGAPCRRRRRSRTPRAAAARSGPAGPAATRPAAAPWPGARAGGREDASCGAGAGAGAGRRGAGRGGRRWLGGRWGGAGAWGGARPGMPRRPAGRRRPRDRPWAGRGSPEAPRSRRGRGLEPAAGPRVPQEASPKAGGRGVTPPHPYSPIPK